MDKQALHADDRLKERTTLSPEVLTRLRRQVLRRRLPRGTHHVRLGTEGYAVLKDVGGRHVVATVLSRHMRPPGKELQLSKVAQQVPSSRSDRSSKIPLLAGVGAGMLPLAGMIGKKVPGQFPGPRFQDYHSLMEKVRPGDVLVGGDRGVLPALMAPGTGAPHLSTTYIATGSSPGEMLDGKGLRVGNLGFAGTRLEFPAGRSHNYVVLRPTRDKAGKILEAHRQRASLENKIYQGLKDRGVPESKVREMLSVSYDKPAAVKGWLRELFIPNILKPNQEAQRTYRSGLLREVEGALPKFLDDAAEKYHKTGKLPKNSKFTKAVRGVCTTHAAMCGAPISPHKLPGSAMAVDFLRAPAGSYEPIGHYLGETGAGKMSPAHKAIAFSGSKIPLLARLGAGALLGGTAYLSAKRLTSRKR